MEAKKAVWSIGVMVYTVSAIMVIMTGSAPAVTVDIYSGHEDGGSGVPYTDFVGSYYSPDIKFGENTENDWHPFGLGDFGAEITGYLIVSAADTYAFTLGSDDGSMLYIDNQLVVDNGAPEGEGHAYLRVTDSAALTAGIHPFRVEFFEDFGGPSGLDLFLPPDIQYGDLTLEKIDDVNDFDCRGPGEEITYTISWNNADNLSFTGVCLIDYLPKGVDYNPILSFNPPVIDPNYNQEDHTYTWPIGTIAPNDSGSVAFTVTVNEGAEPGLYLHNTAELWGVVNDVNVLLATAFQDTPVCCWGDEPNMIYVDCTAGGYDTGVDWENAYSGPDGLQKALARIRDTECLNGPYTIYVAQGTYAPQDTENGFVLPDGCEMYGGFKTGGCDFSERNPKRYKTILTGLIEGEETPASTIVTMGDETLLDGCTVTQALEYCVYGSDVDFIIQDCTVKESYDYGIYAENGNVSVQWCTVSLNDGDGIYHDGEGYTLSVNNSWLLRNGESGILCERSTLTAKNSIISESDLKELSLAGIRMVYPTYPPVLHNLTVSNNRSVGISFIDNSDISGDPNNKDWPDLQNSIVYYNNSGGSQVAGFSTDTIANFCCIQNCSESNTTNYNEEPGFAYVVDPNGIPDPNNYHLAYDSFCVDKANPYLSYTDQVDIDGEGLDRKYGNYVDIGADEVYDCGDDYLSEADVHNDLDWDADGLVNLNEFVVFQKAWLSHDPNDPAWLADPNIADPNLSDKWNPVCNLADTGNSQYTIDLSDLETFLSDAPWLWIACWKLEEVEAAATAQSQSQSLMSQPLSMSFSVYSMETETSAETVESISEVPLETYVQIIGFLDEIIAENPENLEDIQELRAVLMDEIKAIWNRENG